MNENVRNWLYFAQSDLQVAEILLEEKIYNQCCFHVQQCIEKTLKALFIHHYGKIQPKTHIIADLLNSLPSAWFSDIDVISLIKISKYYVITRYPDMLPDISEGSFPGKAETEEAIALAQFTFNKAKHIIENKQL